MSKKLLFKGGHGTAMTPYEIEDFSSLHIRDPRIDEKTKAYIDSVIGNSVLNLCPYRNVLVTHKYDSVEGNVVTLDDCQDDEVIQLSEIQGNTMVNCNKDTDKELILMPNLDTSGYSNVTIAEGVDGGKVDVSLQGNTMVNVCDQEEPVAITKSYTVETGNHIALQGEYDGKCRPNVYGNTLVNLADPNTSKTFSGTTRTYRVCNDNSIIKENTTYTCIIKIADLNLGQLSSILLQIQMEGFDSPGSGSSPYTVNKNGIHLLTFTTTTRNNNNTDKTLILKGVSSQWTEASTNTMIISNVVLLEGDYTNKPIPDYFTGMKSSFEDKLVPENLGLNDLHTNSSKLVVSDNYIEYNIQSTDGQPGCYVDLPNLKPLTDYTLIFNMYDYSEGALHFRLMQNTTVASNEKFTQNNGLKVFKFTSKADTVPNKLLMFNRNNMNNRYKIGKKVYIVEGDYTNYDFTDYDSTKAGKYKVDYKVTGKNKFPPCPTTSVSGNGITFTYDATTQIFSYKGTATNTSAFISIPCPDLKLLKDKSYLFNIDKSLNNFSLQITELGVGYNCNLPPNATATPIINLDKYIPNAIMLYSQNLTIGQSYSGTFKVQLEEGTTATTYEPYKESIKTLYLNSPLLEGDTIEQSGNNIIHNHRSELVAYAEGDETSLITDKVNTLHQLATPTQEIISTNDNLLLDSYTNGHLDVDTVVPIDKVMFNDSNWSLKYLYPNTEYTIQFESDNVGKIDYIYTNGATTNENNNVAKGLNKFTLTTPNEVEYTAIVMSGIGFNASKIVVTPKVDNDFGYFKGMKSVGECEDNKIEILSSQNKVKELLRETCGGSDGTAYKHNARVRTNIFTVTTNKLYIGGLSEHDSMMVFCYDVNGNYLGRPYEAFKKLKEFTLLTNTKQVIVVFKDIDDKIILPSQYNNVYIYELSNKQTLTHEPLRGLPNGVKDKYVIIDGKWYIKRNTATEIIGKPTNFGIVKTMENVSRISFGTKNQYKTLSTTLSCNFKSDKTDDDYEHIRMDGSTPYSSALQLYLNNSKIGNITRDNVATYLTNNPFIIIGEAYQPTYEPIEYNPFEVYTDTTHISNNSTIPCNMVIRNSGFNCILKPNTTYTVSSNNGLSTVTTKNSIGDSVLRFYDKDTTSINTMNNVLVLEGDYVTGNPPIPAFFKGMESAFEQELVTDENDEHYGKYKVEVLAKNKNLFTSEVIDALCTLENWVGNGSYRNNYVAYNLMNFKAGTTYTNTIPEIKVPPHFYPILFLDNANGHFLASGLYQNDTDNEKIVSARTYTFSPQSKGYFRAYVYDWNDENMQKLRKVLEQNIQTEIGKTSTEFVEPKQNKIQFFLNEPLRGVGNVKDKVYVKEDKIVVQRNCSSVTFDGSDDENWSPTGYGGHATRNTFEIGLRNINAFSGYTLCISNLFIFEQVGGLPTNDNAFRVSTNAQNDSYFLFTPSTDMIPYRDTNKWKEYLQQNPVKVVYQLATPVYEEVECDLSKLALEGYNHGTLFYNSNIPVTTQFYDFKVNIKDMLIPNEIYYITFIADRVKDITINLSGVQVNYKTSMGYNKIPVQLGDVINTNFSMESRGVELNDLMISTSTSLIYVKDINDVCIYDEASNKYSITITSTDGNESDKRVILLDYPLLRLNKDIYDRLYYNNKDSKYRIDKKVFKHKFTNDHEYSKYAVETNDTYYSSFISLNETIKDYVVITNEKVKTVKVEDDKYYFKIKWSDLGVSDKTEANGNQGMKDFFNNNEVYLYYATDGFVEIVDGLSRQTLKVYQPETIMNFLGNTTTTVTIVIPKKNI